MCWLLQAKRQFAVAPSRTGMGGESIVKIAVVVVDGGDVVFEV